MPARDGRGTVGHLSVPPNTSTAVDVCIVGAGPAGITLARELAGSRCSVVLLESGTETDDRRARELTRGTTHGDPFPALDVQRARRFGGSANTWQIEIGGGRLGGRFAELQPVDFERRDELPGSGWPFGYGTLRPYYGRARAHLALQSDDRDASGTFDDFEDADLAFAPRTTFTGAADELRELPNVRLVLGASVVRLELVDDAVRRVHARRYDASALEVDAAAVVLAAGAIENARLLLLSGIGERLDAVGRYLMDHPVVAGGILRPASRAVFARMGRFDHGMPGTHATGVLRLSDAALRRRELLGFGALFYPQPRTFGSPAVAAAKALARPRGSTPRELGRQLAVAARGLDEVALKVARRVARREPTAMHGLRGGWTQLDERELRRYTLFEVQNVTEQAPVRDNRVVLSSERDAFGCPRADVHWRWDELSRASVRAAQRLLADDLRRARLGELVLAERDGWPILLDGAHHIMGTTRMSAGAGSGVVDATGRVHGVANLFVAGSSVFPTGGFVNPTLTVIALAARLADELGRGVR